MMNPIAIYSLTITKVGRLSSRLDGHQDWCLVLAFSAVDHRPIHQVNESI